MAPKAYRVKAEITYASYSFNLELLSTIMLADLLSFPGSGPSAQLHNPHLECGLTCGHQAYQLLWSKVKAFHSCN